MYNFDYADEEEAEGKSDRDLSPTPSTATQSVQPGRTRTAARKCRGSSQTTADR